MSLCVQRAIGKQLQNFLAEETDEGMTAFCDVPSCCIRFGPDEERILDVVPREDGARNSG